MVVRGPKELIAKYRSTFVSWNCMLARCHYVKKKQKCYEGIEICERWFSFVNFLKDMGPRPSTDHSLDRKEASKGYNKENCQWLTKAENSRKIDKTSLHSKERADKISQKLKEGHANGTLKFSEDRLAAISKGGVKRTGRKLQMCVKCGRKAYTEICQRCKGQRNRS